MRMSRRRQTIASRLLEAQRTAAILTTFNEVDMTAIIDIRARRREQFQKRHGVGLGFMSFFTKAAVGALREFPTLGVHTNNEFLLRILDHPRFRAGDIDTGFLDAEGAGLAASSPAELPGPVQAAVAAHESESREETRPSHPDPWESLRQWRA
jgi:hypothetical protein